MVRTAKVFARNIGCIINEFGGDDGLLKDSFSYDEFIDAYKRGDVDFYISLSNWGDFLRILVFPKEEDDGK